MKILILTMLLLAQRPAATPLQTGSISGRLLNADGLPAARTRVSAMPAPDSPAKPADGSTLMTLVETDSDGRYILADVPVGRYFVVAGFLDSPTYYPRGTVLAGATAINVTANSRTANIDFRMEGASSSFSVSGRVTFESGAGRPPGNSMVRLTGGPANTSFVPYTELSATTGLDGSFEIQRVRPGAYTLSLVSAPFFTPKSVVVVDKDVKGIEVVAPWTIEVTGKTAVEGNLGPVPQFSVMFTGAGRQTTSYQSGQGFRTTLGEGFYAVTVIGLPSGFYLKAMEADSTDLTTNPLHVGKDQPVASITVTVGVSSPSPWVKVSGHIVPPGSKVDSITLNGTTGTYESRIAPDGSFQFPKVLPGTYNANIHASVSTSTPFQQSLTFVVPSRDISGIEINVPAVREISGRVLVEGGAPMMRPNLSLTSPLDPLAPTANAGSNPTLGQLLVTVPLGRPLQTSVYFNLAPDGSFKTTLIDGQYQLAATLPSSNGAVSPFAIKELRYGDSDLLKVPLVVSSDVKELLVKVAPTTAISAVKVSGRVEGLMDSPGTTATIRLENPLYLSSYVTNVAADGSFEIPKVFPGAYTARFTANSVNSNLIPTHAVNVSDRDVANLQFVVPRQREISGKITMEGKGPLPVFSLFLSSLPINAAAPGGVQQNFPVNPQANGSFKLTIPEGNWYIGRTSSLPVGYNIKDIAYGPSSVLNSALNVSANISELRVTVTSTNAAPVKVTGKVTNVDAIPKQNPPAVVLMNAQGIAVTMRSAIAADGSFEFPEVFPGNYTARISSVLPNLGTVSTAVNVSSKDVSDVVLAVPRTVEVSGKIVLEGRGAMPRLTLPLMFGTRGEYAAVSTMAGSLIINPSADGSFKVIVPATDRRLGMANGLPAGYTVKSMTMGTVDLMTSEIEIKPGDVPQMRIVVSTPDLPGVKVSGSVAGLEAVTQPRGSIRVRLSSNGFVSPIEAPLANDGSFEFSDVYPGSYTALVAGIPNVQTVSTPITVGSTEVKNAIVSVLIAVPITGRITVEGNAPLPRMSFIPAQAATSPAGTGLFSSGPSLSTSVISINPLPDGTLRLLLLEGERPLGRVSNLPPGYTLKSVTYGTTDLLRSPLKISRSDPSEFAIVLTATGLKPVSVSGQVDGLDAAALAQGTATVVLNSSIYAVGHGAVVKPDGTFEFPSVFPGNYTAQVVRAGLGAAAAGPPGLVAVASGVIGGASIGGLVAPPVPNSIVVADKNITDFRVTAPVR